MTMTFDEFYKKYKAHCFKHAPQFYSFTLDATPGMTKPTFLWLFIKTSHKVGSLYVIDSATPRKQTTLLQDAPMEKCFQLWETQVLRRKLAGDDQ
jgi:hypothetical protein